MFKWKSAARLAAAASLVALTACSDDGSNGNGPEISSSVEQSSSSQVEQTEVLQGVIDKDMTLSADTQYELDGFVFVAAGATLTIEPGTKIVAEGKSALIVRPGAKIMSEGTKAKPIVFTSKKSSPVTGDWAGVVVMGKAPVSTADNTLPFEAEESEVFGGNKADDNSGIIKYTRIEYAGWEVAADKELNGLTLGGVGSGTTLSYVQIHEGKDDGIEWFGGTVDCQNLIVWGQGDDAFDIDQSYDGTITNFMAICTADSDHALEIDGGEGTMNNPFRMEYGTLYSPDTAQVHLRDGAKGYISIAGIFNVESDAGTDVVVDSLVIGVDEMIFDWTYSYSKGAY